MKRSTTAIAGRIVAGVVVGLLLWALLWALVAGGALWTVHRAWRRQRAASAPVEGLRLVD